MQTFHIVDVDDIVIEVVLLVLDQLLLLVEFFILELNGVEAAQEGVLLAHGVDE